MKLIQQILEMAKGRNVRKRAKKRAIKKKAKTPVASKTRNLAAMDMQTTGAGAHGSESTKERKGRAGRRDAKKQIRKELDY